MSKVFEAVLQVGSFRQKVALSVHPHHKGGMKFEAGTGSLTIEGRNKAVEFVEEVIRVWKKEIE
jgi:hypothetical protein